MRQRLATLLAVGALLTGMLVTGGVVTAANQGANLDQCANDPSPSSHSDGCNSNATQWVNGNLGASKSVYFEGDSIPYRMTMSNLVTTPSVIHHLVIEWDTTKGGTHALDYLTTWNASVGNANPCLGISGSFCTGTLAGANQTAIPKDLQVDPGTPPGTGAAGGQPGGVFALWGGTVTSLSGYSYSNGTGFAGDKSASIQINFTAQVPNPVLAWGGHIATRQAWGPLKSAVTIPGSPYHTRLISLDGAGGNQDRSLSADAVIFPGFIHIVKNTVGGNGQFAFTASPSPLADFNLTTVANTAEKDFDAITNFQTYTVTETAPPPPAGFAFTSLTCAVVSPNGGSRTVSGRTATIVLNEGEQVTCTYTNTFTANTTGLSTTPSETTGKIGDTLSDSATLTGATTGAGGTISFYLFAPGATCDDTAPITGFVYSSTGVPVSGNGTYASSAGTTKTGSAVTTGAGTYTWVAVYTGDGNNNGSKSSCGSEDVVIGPNTTGLSTTPSETTGKIGDTLTDSATLTGATTGATGTINFYLFAPGATCDDTAPITGFVYSATGVPVSGNGTYSSANATGTTGSNVTTAAGTYTWVAVYTDGADNTSSKSSCGSEDVVISPNTTGLSTTPSETTGKIGDTLSDSATLTGATTGAGGTISFYLFAPGATCDDTAPITGFVYSSTGVPVSGNGTYASSAGTTKTGSAVTTGAGTYTWVAVYTGDGNNNGSKSSCGSEDVVIAKNSPSIDTTPKLLPNDSIHLTGLTAGATGSLYVELQIDAPCGTANPAYSKTWDDGLTGNDVFTGNGTYQTANTTVFVTASHTIQWCTSYSGDANNAARALATDGETIGITFNAPAIVLGGAAFGFGIPLLLMGFWNRRKRNAKD
jgi:hypothetical protein